MVVCSGRPSFLLSFLCPSFALFAIWVRLRQRQQAMERERWIWKMDPTTIEGEREREREMKINTPLLARQAGWSCAAWPHPQARSCSRRSTFGAQSSNATVEGIRPKRPHAAPPPQSQPHANINFPREQKQASIFSLPSSLSLRCLLACELTLRRDKLIRIPVYEDIILFPAV